MADKEDVHYNHQHASYLQRATRRAGRHRPNSTRQAALAADEQDYDAAFEQAERTHERRLRRGQPTFAPAHWHDDGPTVCYQPDCNPEDTR